MIHSHPPTLSSMPLSRRQALGLSAASLLAPLGLHAEQIKKQQRACILVWLAGAPSQMETWDPKPGTGNGGPTKAIKTALPGVSIAEHWPQMAKALGNVAIIRSMVGKEAAHARGTYHLHTGRRLGGPEKHPNFGSVVAAELGDTNSELPNFVSVGQTLSSGFLGVNVAPFIVNRAGQLPANVSTAVASPRVSRRLALLKAQDADLSKAGAASLVEEHRVLYERARRLMTSPKLKSFKLDGEPAARQQAYGKNPFGQGLLVARRLVEAGVPFVEVRRGGWDMHNSLFTRIKPAAAQVDRGVASLLGDLKRRGLLERTLVIVAGEFGRTPKVNSKSPAPGRDHWARSFGLMLAGAGIRGGHVVGKTSANGQEVVDRAVSVEDLFQTICSAMKIDADKELFTPGGRPLKIVDGGKPISEILG
ncbi:MAG TPA: DUF1501 domain-containing protein [Planctomycetaceae bacterium]|nr:DUF1501 domain-containing protein [Planctomycetaceae bacterium]HCD00661.1 DUF1501 domain-containing protein [Planctomycetaceae bacterium]